jgi:hypothetical protein
VTIQQDTQQQETRTSRIGILGLLSGLIGDVRTLFRQELQLMRDEFFSEVAKVRQGTMAIGAGVACAGIGGILLLIMLVQVLHEFAGLPLWASYGVIGFILLVVGSALLVKGKYSLQTFSAMPRKSLRSMKEDAQWIKEQMSSKI